MSEETIDINSENSGVEEKTMDDYTGGTGNNPNENSDDNQSDNPQNNSDMFGAPESYDYSKIELPENMELDTDLVNKFNPLAKELNLSNQAAGKLMSLAVELIGKQGKNFTEAQSQLKVAERNSYIELLNNDKELNSYSNEQYDQYLSIAKLGVDKVATAGFKQILKDKGLANHPEFIKTFHEIGKLCKDDSVGGNYTPAGAKESAAKILFGNV